MDIIGRFILDTENCFLLWVIVKVVIFIPLSKIDKELSILVLILKLFSKMHVISTYTINLLVYLSKWLLIQWHLKLLGNLIFFNRILKKLLNIFYLIGTSKFILEQFIFLLKFGYQWILNIKIHWIILIYPLLFNNCECFFTRD